MVSETHLALISARIVANSLHRDDIKNKPWVEIDSQKQISIENIQVWEINDGINRLYRISILGLAQNNYNDRVMIRGKQTERHVIGQYIAQNIIVSAHSIEDYISKETQTEYLKLLATNNIRGCIEYLRKIETALNSQVEKEQKKSMIVRVRTVKKGK